jgi:hypothetical protein
MPPVIKFIAKAVAFAIILPAGLLAGGTLAFITYETHPDHGELKHCRN